MITSIIVNYRSSSLTIRSAQSVLNDFPSGQVIVIDNSEDPKEAEDLKSGLPPSVDLHISETNVGFGRACNLGFEYAKHEWIFLINPDAYVIPGCMETLMSFMISKPKAGAVSPLSYWDHERSWYLPPGQMPSPVVDFAMSLAMRFARLGLKSSLGFRSWALKKLQSKTATKMKMLSGGHMMLRRSAIEACCGLFDGNIFMYYEDTDLCRRLASMDFELYLLPTAEVTHSWQCAPSKGHLSEASHEYYTKKHFPNSPWSIAKKLVEQTRQVQLYQNTDLGILKTPPILDIPNSLQQGWILEASAHPLLIPAAYLFGKGPTATISEEIWSFLGAGQYWIQISPDKTNITSREIKRFTFQV